MNSLAVSLAYSHILLIEEVFNCIVSIYLFGSFIPFHLWAATASSHVCTDLLKRKKGAICSCCRHAPAYHSHSSAIPSGCVAVMGV